jgi:tRNA threonylcarbamoyladenosine biosynthesis protein TsaB
MFLIINTAEKNKTILIIFKFKNNSFSIISKYSFKRNYHQAEKLLPSIDRLFKKNKKITADLKGVAVITGPGPFTALRVGITIANTMAFALKISVVGIKLDEFKNTKELIELSYKKFKKAKLKKIAIPFYGKEPNITIA